MSDSKSKILFVLIRSWVFWAVVIPATLLILVLLSLFCPPLLAAFSLVAEVAVALVIYYEVEEQRATSFLEQARGKAYEERGEIYDHFLEMPSGSLRERAEAFCKYLWENEPLRKKCDYQLLHFTHLKFILRRSILHSTLLEEVFPQVPVCLWAMLSAYIKDIESRRFRPAKEIMAAVVASIDSMEQSKKGLQPISMFSVAKKLDMKISVDDLKSMRDEIKSRLKNV